MPTRSLVGSRVPRPGGLYPGGLVLMDLTLGDLMTSEYSKGLWHIPVCDFSEAWSLGV